MHMATLRLEGGHEPMVMLLWENCEVGTESQPAYRNSDKTAHQMLILTKFLPL